jgi:hypothetical protein
MPDRDEKQGCSRFAGYLNRFCAKLSHFRTREAMGHFFRVNTGRFIGWKRSA